MSASIHWPIVFGLPTSHHKLFYKLIFVPTMLGCDVIFVEIEMGACGIICLVCFKLYGITEITYTRNHKNFTLNKS